VYSILCYYIVCSQSSEKVVCLMHGLNNLSDWHCQVPKIGLAKLVGELLEETLHFNQWKQ
jgi:hypothetical protein